MNQRDEVGVPFAEREDLRREVPGEHLLRLRPRLLVHPGDHLRERRVGVRREPLREVRCSTTPSGDRRARRSRSSRRRSRTRRSGPPSAGRRGLRAAGRSHRSPRRARRRTPSGSGSATFGCPFAVEPHFLLVEAQRLGDVHPRAFVERRELRDRRVRTAVPCHRHAVETSEQSDTDPDLLGLERRHAAADGIAQEFVRSALRTANGTLPTAAPPSDTPILAGGHPHTARPSRGHPKHGRSSASTSRFDRAERRPSPIGDGRPRPRSRGVLDMGRRARRASSPRSHPNGIDRIDHVVYAVPELDAAIDADDGHRSASRRDAASRRGGRTGPEMAFFRAGEGFIEVVGVRTAGCTVGHRVQLTRPRRDRRGDQGRRRTGRRSEAAPSRADASPASGKDTSTGESPSWSPREV